MPSRGAAGYCGHTQYCHRVTFVMFGRVLQQFAAGGGLHRPAHRALLWTSEICCSTGTDAGVSLCIVEVELLDDLILKKNRRP